MQRSRGPHEESGACPKGGDGGYLAAVSLQKSRYPDLIRRSFEN